MERLDHYTHWRQKDDPVMRCLAHRIQADLTKPRWLSAEQYTWLLMNEGERHGWFSKWISACRVQFTHWWVRGEQGPRSSYTITPFAR